MGYKKRTDPEFLAEIKRKLKKRIREVTENATLAKLADTYAKIVKLEKSMPENTKKDEIIIKIDGIDMEKI